MEKASKATEKFVPMDCSRRILQERDICAFREGFLDTNLWIIQHIGSDGIGLARHDECQLKLLVGCVHTEQLRLVERPEPVQSKGKKDGEKQTSSGGQQAKGDSKGQQRSGSTTK